MARANRVICYSCHFIFNTEDNCVKKIVGSTNFYYPFSHYEISGTTTIKYYFFNGQRVAMRSGSTLTYLHVDLLGSTVLETNISGTVTSDEKYRAYGKQRDTGSVSTDHRFTGHPSATLRNRKEDANEQQRIQTATDCSRAQIGLVTNPLLV